jgi:hypothetical protein
MQTFLEFVYIRPKLEHAVRLLAELEVDPYDWILDYAKKTSPILEAQLLEDLNLREIGVPSSYPHTQKQQGQQSFYGSVDTGLPFAGQPQQGQPQQGQPQQGQPQQGQPQQGQPQQGQPQQGQPQQGQPQQGQPQQGQQPINPQVVQGPQQQQGQQGQQQGGFWDRMKGAAQQGWSAMKDAWSGPSTKYQQATNALGQLMQTFQKIDPQGQQFKTNDGQPLGKWLDDVIKNLQGQSQRIPQLMQQYQQQGQQQQ